MKNPAVVLPDTLQAINALYKAVHSAGMPKQVLELVHLRASQINGCSPCVDAGARTAKKAGVTDEKLFALAAWRETPYFSDAERAALALAEAATRLSDRADRSPTPSGRAPPSTTTSSSSRRWSSGSRRPTSSTV